MMSKTTNVFKKGRNSEQYKIGNARADNIYIADRKHLTPLSIV